ncbi:MAG: RNA polymerase sigma factor [Bacteroidales bacterium]|nr:RNA polymerase sigma factor [Bacteroidales bacterium]
MQLGKYNGYRDEDLIPLILEGQNALYEILYNRYKIKVLNKCYNLLKNKDLSEDAQQIIFEKAYEKLSTFKGKASFSSWLYSITYNYCIDFLRNKKKLNYPEWNRKQEFPEIVDEIAEEDNQVNYENLQGLLDKIHPEEKALLMMKYTDNLSISDIANALRLTESATKMRLKRARARLLYLYKQTYKLED